MKLAPWILLLAAIIAVGCSSQRVDKVTSSSDRLSRAISSSTSPEALEAVYQQILEDPEPAKRLESFFERLVRIYYRSEALVRDYDAKLDVMYKNQDHYKGSDLITDDSYSKLMAAWIISNRQIEKISYLYKKNYKEVYGRKKDSSYNQQDQERDLKIKRAFMMSIKKFGANERLAMQNLLTHLGEVALEAHNEIRLNGANKDAKEFNSLSFQSSSEQTAYYQRKKRKSSNKSQYENYDQDIELELMALQPEVSEHLKDMFDGREPQSAGEVVPSSSSKGNLTGNTFKTGRWALTYDDGPSAKHTTKILDNLEAKAMVTSFFWLAELTPRYQTLINRSKTLGMALGNHSFSHKNLPKFGQSTLNKEINESTAVHTRMYGFKPTYFRCPYGACGGNGSNIRQMIANQGMVHIFWNVDSLDWQDKNPASIVNRVTKAMAVAKRGIILFHDIHPQSVEATRLLMNSWAPQVRSGNMRLITIPQAIEELNSEAGMQ